MHSTWSRSCHRRLAWVFIAAMPSLALAHDAWFEPTGNGLEVQFGHPDKHQAYAAEKVISFRLLDTTGKPVTGTRQLEGDALRVVPAVQPALATLLFDNGVWSRASMDTPARNVPKNELPGAISGNHSLKTHKLILNWGPVVTQAQGQTLEIVPQAAQAPAAGTRLPVQVLWQGQPLAAAHLVHSESDKEPPIRTDAQGRALVPVKPGRQMLLVTHRVDLAGDPRADRATWTANLVFNAR